MSIADKLTTIAENQTKVYEAGKKAEYDEFWDTYQENGNRTSYNYAFARVWNDKFYNPKYPIICSANTYSAESVYTNSAITDTKVPIIIRNTRADSIFQDCVSLKRIPSLTFENLSRFAATCFRNCKALEEMNVYGEINVTGMDVSASTKLTHDSLMSIINALKDYSTEGGTYKVTLGATNLAKLSDTEKAIATNKGWELA